MNEIDGVEIVLLDKVLYRCFVLQNFRIATKSGNVFSAYWKYFFVRHSSVIRHFILWRVSAEKLLSVCCKYVSAIRCYSKVLYYWYHIYCFWFLMAKVGNYYSLSRLVSYKKNKCWNWAKRGRIPTSVKKHKEWETWWYHFSSISLNSIMRIWMEKLLYDTNFNKLPWS